MNKIPIILCVFFAHFFTPLTLKSQNLPISEWTVNSHEKPFIFYISGDGGMNKFSTSLCEALHDKGFDVSALMPGLISGIRKRLKKRPMM